MYDLFCKCRLPCWFDEDSNQSPILTKPLAKSGGTIHQLTNGVFGIRVLSLTFGKHTL